MSSTYMELDSRRKLSLAKIAADDVNGYLVTREPSGRIILEPAVVMTMSEEAALRSPEIRAKFDEAKDSTSFRPRKARRTAA